jgi:hypothetical protein
VLHKLYDGLEKSGTFPILSALREHPQLLICRGQHLEPFEGSHASRKVSFGSIKPFYVCGHRGNAFLGFGGPDPNILDLREQLCEVLLGRLHPLKARIRSVGLDKLQSGDIGGKSIIVSLDGMENSRNRGNSRGMTEDQIQVLNRIIVD